jgi:hypothetical protein
MKVTYIKISEGKVYASGEVKPVPEDDILHMYDKNGYDEHVYKLNQFRNSFVEVSNQLTFYIDLAVAMTKGFMVPIGLAKKVDGLYPVSGMVMEVKEFCKAFLPQGIDIATPRAEHGCIDCHGNCYSKAQFCTINFDVFGLIENEQAINEENYPPNK